jgi:hypothetical protein
MQKCLLLFAQADTDRNGCVGREDVLRLLDRGNHEAERFCLQVWFDRFGRAGSMDFRTFCFGIAVSLDLKGLGTLHEDDDGTVSMVLRDLLFNPFACFTPKSGGNPALHRRSAL